jgi:hypothetical protein
MTRNSEAGQTLALVALGLVALMGFAGLAVDMGVLRYDKRLQQTAADAAAVAGANDLGYGGVTAGAQAASAANGFQDNGGGAVSSCGSGAAIGTICVEIDNPPADGPHAGNSNYVEARVAAVQPTYFMRVFGVNQEAVTARAVATNLSGPSAGGGGCLYTLAPPSQNGVEGVNITGHGTLNATSCGIIDNGNYDPNDPAITVNNCSFGVVGSNTGSTNSNVTCNGAVKNPTYGIPAGPNPLASLPAPTKPAPSSTCPTPGQDPCNASGGGTLQPGEYTSITFGANSTTTLSPGIYYIDGTGGLTFNGKATVTGTGVMFYLTCPAGTSPCSNGATVNATGGGNVPDINLTAPTSTNCPACPSQYDGILMDQDPNDTNAPSLGGDDSSNFLGILYFPTVELSFFGNAKSGGFNAGIVIAAALSLTGNPTVNLEGPTGLQAAGVTTSIVSVTTLVE